MSLELCNAILHDRGHDFLLQLSASHGSDATPSLAEIKGPELTAEEKCSVVQKESRRKKSRLYQGLLEKTAEILDRQANLVAVLVAGSVITEVGARCLIEINVMATDLRMTLVGETFVLVGLKTSPVSVSYWQKTLRTSSSLSSYLDDILQKNLCPITLQRDLATLRETLTQLGWIVNLQKSDLIPSQRFVHLDALTFSWTDIDAYVFPPFPLVAKIVSRLPLFQCDLTLIAPLRGVSLIELSKAVGWSQHTTFGRFYLRLPDSPLPADAIEKVPVYKHVTGQQLFNRFRPALCKECEKYMLPHLVQKASPEATSLIRLVASIQAVPNRGKKKVIMDNMKYIFSHLVCSCQKQEMEMVLDYIQKETDFTLGSLLRLDFQRVHDELLLHLSTNYKQAMYLQPRLLGVLAFFDSQLVNTNVALADKKLALESLISILNLMDSEHIGSIRYKVMNTLRLELQLLGPMMFPILATLLPLLMQMPRQVADIINYMVVENRSELQKYFHEIYFLPDLPELADANAVLKNYRDNPGSQGNLQSQLVQCMKGTSHESLDVRIHALSKLRRLLREKRLLQGCREPNSKMQCRYGQCLGELGALDPGRLQLMINNPREQHAKFQASVEDDNFAVGLINTVIKAFLAATEPKVQDCAAFALQELLQIYKIHEKREGEFETPGAKLWKRFPEQFQQILHSLFNTRYKINCDKDWSSLPKPIYGSIKGGNFRDWVSNWTCYLVSKVKDGKAQQVFQACTATNYQNVQVALYLLPHVVVQVLLDGRAEDHVEMYNEVMEVVNHATKTDTRQRSKSDLNRLSTQTVFSVLDYLFKWRDHRMQLLSAEPTYAGDPLYKSVNTFLCRIPQDALAQASLHCEAYTRSLMHFEQFVTDNKQNLQEHLDFLQVVPQWTAQLNQYRVEAAWKMSSWDRLDNMMKLEKPDNHSWPVCIGRILMSAKDKKEEEFLKQLQIARQEQMGPLSAASMEMGSYHRGYECILRLHMLGELEEYFRSLHDFPPRSEDSSEPSSQYSLAELLDQWDARLQMAQEAGPFQEGA
nr:hypothetical protein BaRGS_033751 [Batillaria attramentaria]